MKSNSKNFIKRLKNKKTDAIEYVIDEYMPYLKAIVFRILHPIGQSGDIEECLNDVFLMIWQNAGQFDGNEENFKYWAGTIAKYKAIDIFRLIERRNAQVDSKIIEEQLIIQKESVQEKLMNKEERNELLLTLSSLGPLDRDIFIMKFYLEMSNSEIAKTLNLSKASVDNRLYRGKKRLSTKLIVRLEEKWV